MGKIAILYGLTVISLFGCLTIVLSLIGFGKAPPPPAPVREISVKETKLAALEELTDEELFVHLPELIIGVNYVATIATPLHREITDQQFTDQILPEGGVFYTQNFESVPEPGWYEVVVSNGRRDMTRFMRADHLELQFPTYYGKGPSQEDIETHNNRRRVYKSLHMASRKAFIAQTRAEPEEIETGISFSEVTESFAYSVKSLNSKGIVFPILISLFVCSIVAIALALLVGFKKAYSWEQDATLEDYDSEYSSEESEYDPRQFEE